MINSNLLTHSMFDTKHIILLLVSLFCIALLSVLLRKQKMNSILKIVLVCGIVSEVIKVFYYIATNEATYNGYLPKTDLPFQLCSIQLLFIIYLNLSNNEKIKRLLYAFMIPTCMVGGLAALLIPTYSSLNGNFILTFQYFMYHIMIIVFAIYLVINIYKDLTIKDYVNTLIFMGALGMIAIYLNSICFNEQFMNVNFMYVVAPPQDGLPFLNKDHGWLVYIAHFLSLVFIVITITYIKPIIKYFKSFKKQDNKIQ